MKYLDRYSKLGERSRNSLISILLSFVAKGASVIISLLVVPMTINYVNPTQYGVWLTLSSIIAWIGFFDLGLGNGMRNKVAEAKAKGDVQLAMQYVSTTYFTIAAIVVVLFIAIELVNMFLNWSSILNIDVSYTEELKKVFGVLTLFFCLDMLVKLFLSVLQADQKPASASWIGVSGQAFSLLAIYLLTKFTEGSLLSLAIYYSGIPTIVILLVSTYAYRFTSYKELAPRWKWVRRSLIKNILNLGVQFFIIYICILLIFQIINIVISRNLGPDAVTQFNIAFKYFNIAQSVIVIIVVPFWSAFTDAYNKKDVNWMHKVKRLLEIVWICELLLLVIMLFLSNWFYHTWIGDKVRIENNLSIMMALFMAAQGIATIYMHLINGIGTVRVQLITYVIFAVVSWPLMHFSCHLLGLIGVLVLPTIVYIIQAILGKVQIEKILAGNCGGIWSK